VFDTLDFFIAKFAYWAWFGDVACSIFFQCAIRYTIFDIDLYIKKAKINKFGFDVLSVWMCIIKLTFDVYIAAWIVTCGLPWSRPNFSIDNECHLQISFDVGEIHLYSLSLLWMINNLMYATYVLPWSFDSQFWSKTIDVMSIIVTSYYVLQKQKNETSNQVKMIVNSCYYIYSRYMND
jgi:hypothetical protein